MKPGIQRDATGTGTRATAPPRRACRGPAARLFAGLIRIYQRFFSPLLHALAGSHAGCRFYPSCSEYARQAIAEYGAWTGTVLGLKRLLRCGPWSEGGYDPVPGQPGCKHDG